MKWFFALALFRVATVAFAEDYAQYVDMTMPDGGMGTVFRGANIPFGMLMWGANLNGFSVTYLSGASMGVGYSNALPILPTISPHEPFSRIYEGRIIKPPTTDYAEPGYLRSAFHDGIVAEFTTTARTGISRFHFPPREKAKVEIYLDHRQNEVTVTDQGLSGWTIRNKIKIFFVVKFDRPIQGSGTWKNIFTHPGVTQGNDVNGVYVEFDTRENPDVMMKIGISFVSAENAGLNLTTENPAWDFEAVKSQARVAWNEKLSRIEIEGGTLEEKKFFYTHFSHALMNPNVITDVNGEYPGFDGKIHRAEGYTHYANYSGWDIYRSWVELISMILPKEASDMMQSLVVDAEQCGGGMPRWPVWNRETGVMAEGSATPIVASAYAFGARDFDAERAFRILDFMESDPNSNCQGYITHYGLEDYMKRGFIPADTGFKNNLLKAPSTLTGSFMLEYSIGDFALSQFAKVLGKPQDRVEFYSNLSHRWKNIFDSSIGYIHPRFADGSWVEPFSPRPDFTELIIKSTDQQGFDEGNSGQYTWIVPHELRVLFDLIGGNGKVNARLDDLFKELNDGSSVIPFNFYGKYEWIGNEPGFLQPWEYNWAGTPWKTQALVRKILSQEFFHKLPGDDDLGAVGSWGVWGALGLYPAIAGYPGLTLGSPLFPKATIHLGSGKTLEIIGQNASFGSPYVQSVSLNGSELTRAWIDLDGILSSLHTQLNFDLGTQPTAWASRPEDAPPSF